LAIGIGDFSAVGIVPTQRIVNVDHHNPTRFAVPQLSAGRFRRKGDGPTTLKVFAEKGVPGGFSVIT
jgi:hypothetical protein